MSDTNESKAPSDASESSEAKSIYKEGFSLFVKGEVDAAIARYRDALEVDATLAIAWNGLSMALARKGDLEAAVDRVRGGPAAISSDASFGKVRRAIKTMVVARASASAARFRSSGSTPETSWPVTNCTRRASSRRVSGMPTAAAAALAELTPGTISKPIRAVRIASTSSSSLPKMPGSPDFSRTTRAPLLA